MGGGMRFTKYLVGTVAALLLPLAAQGQTSPLTLAWAPKPVASPYAAPNRPHVKLADLLATHAGQKDWQELIVRDLGGLTGSYVQIAPGGKSKPRFYVDARMFFIVVSGQLRVSIEGQAPFIASRDFMVQVPARIPFQVETVGDAPALRFEVTHTRATPYYPAAETPTPSKGENYVRVAFAGAPGSFGTSKPYLDFDRAAADGSLKPGGFVRDGEIAANIVRGPAVPRPPDSDPGHFHDGTSEFWFVMEGEVDFLIEGVPFFAAAPGDIVYAPAGRWHRTSFGGTGTSTRISIHPVGAAINNLDPEKSAAAQ
jgi:mannose-6-phosphate isomerase-like protein (cupin superfamily)